MYITYGLTKAVKTCQIYGIRHPAFRDAHTQFFGYLERFLKEHKELNLEIDEFTIQSAGETIYREEDTEISIAFKLFRDGIRRISFIEGVTFEEVARFVEIISRPAREEDIALSLLETDLVNVHFYVVEEEDEIIDYQPPKGVVEDIDYEEKIRSIIEREKLDPEGLPGGDLSVDDVRTLEQQVRGDERMSMLPQAITILINSLKEEGSEDVVAGLTELLKRSIDDRDFLTAGRIAGAMQSIPDGNWLQEIETEETILGFQDVVNATGDELFGRFMTFIDVFSPKSLPHFVKLSAFVRRQDRLVRLRRRLAQLVRDEPAALQHCLQSRDVSVILNAVAILGMMGTRRILPFLQRLVNHPEPAVRVEVIEAVRSARESAMVTRFLDDQSQVVRLKALQTLTQIPYPPVFQQLLRRLKLDDFPKLDMKEQREYLRCLAANGGDELLQIFRGMLFKRFLFRGKKYRMMRKLAASGLAQMNSEESLAILQEGAQHRKKDIRVACEMALKRL